jgi:hypothetical protein
MSSSAGRKWSSCKQLDNSAVPNSALLDYWESFSIIFYCLISYELTQLRHVESKQCKRQERLKDDQSETESFSPRGNGFACKRGGSMLHVAFAETKLMRMDEEELA